MKPILSALVVTILALQASADILISQYYEGSSNNKWIELTNTGASAVSLNGFVLTRFSNADTENWKVDAAAPSFSEALDGFSIPAGGFFLVGNASAVLPSYAIADLTSGVTNFNGDDSVVLYDSSLGLVGDTIAVVDAIGFTDVGNEGANTSFYRLSNGAGYNFTAGSTVNDFPAVWGTKTNSQVDTAMPADDWYLNKFASADALTVSLAPTSVSESAGTGVVDVTVTRTGDTTSALDVTLSSGDETEATIPNPNVQIPAGQASETFTMAIDAVDDLAADGDQTVTITAVATGFTDGTADLTVTDDGDVSPIVINEIMADPTGTDTNGDGVFDTGDDEFVEIVNISGAPLDMSFWELSDAFNIRHVFPDGTIVPTDCAIVVFGGGTPALGGSAIYQVASNGFLGLTNGGDTVSVANAALETVATYTYGTEGGNDESLTRDPDLTGAFGGHTTATGSGGAAASPGTEIDGTAFCAAVGTLSISLSAPSMSEDGGSIIATLTRTGDLSGTLAATVSISDLTEAEVILSPPNTAIFAASSPTVDVTIDAVNDIAQDGTQTVTITAMASGYDSGSADFDVLDDGDLPFSALVINEILYDPHPDSPPATPNGDANGDGVREGSQDEFVEIVNVSGSDFTLTGFQLHDAVGLRHVFEDPTVLAPGQAIVVFGGGAPNASGFGGALVQLASTGFLGLNNGGDSVVLKDPGGGELLRVDYDGTVQDESITRDPDLTGTTLVAHSGATGSGGALFSPGTEIDGTPFGGGTTVDAAVITVISVDLVAFKVALTFTGVPGYSYTLKAGSTLQDGFPFPVAPTAGSTVPDGSGDGSLEFDYSPGTFFFRLEN